MAAGRIGQEDLVFELPHPVRTDGGDLLGVGDFVLGMRHVTLKGIHPRQRHVEADHLERDGHPGQDLIRDRLSFQPPTELDQALEGAVEEIHSVASVGAVASRVLETESIHGKARLEVTMEVPRPSSPARRQRLEVRVADVRRIPATSANDSSAWFVSPGACGSARGS